MSPSFISIKVNFELFISIKVASKKGSKYLKLLFNFIFSNVSLSFIFIALIWFKILSSMNFFVKIPVNTLSELKRENLLKSINLLFNPL